MSTVFEILEEIENTQGTKAKTEILKAHAANRRLVDVMQLTHNPYVNFYIGCIPENSSNNKQQNGSSDESLDSLLSALRQCMTGDLRGNAGKEYVSSILSEMSGLDHKWSCRIILKKLRLGIGDSTITKLWPGLLSSFEVSLAKEVDWEIENEKLVLKTPINYPARVEPKWDGFRCIAVKVAGVVTLFARSGRVFDQAKKIDAFLEENMKDGWVLDGELMGEEWNDTASIVSSKKNHKDDSGLFYHVFDCMEIDVWRSHGTSKQYSERLDDIKKAISLDSSKKQPVKTASGKTVTCESELISFYEECIAIGYEGIMIKCLDAPYVFKRSSSVMKLKPIATYDGVVTEVLMGKEGTKWSEKYSRITVQLPNAKKIDNETTVTIVGTGFKDLDREFLNKERNNLVGRACEIVGQPPLTDDGKIRFPRFKRWREDWDVSPEVSSLIAAVKNT